MEFDTEDQVLFFLNLEMFLIFQANSALLIIFHQRSSYSISSIGCFSWEFSIIFIDSFVIIIFQMFKMKWKQPTNKYLQILNWKLSKVDSVQHFTGDSIKTEVGVSDWNKPKRKWVFPQIILLIFAQKFFRVASLRMDDVIWSVCLIDFCWICQK